MPAIIEGRPPLRSSVRQLLDDVDIDEDHATKAPTLVQHHVVPNQEQTGHSTLAIRRASIRRQRPPRLIQQINGAQMSPPLEELVKQHNPLDLTNRVKVKDGPPVDNGGFATIHMGDLDGTQVAVKAFIKQKLSKKLTSEDIQRLSKEIRVSAVLSHPNILETRGFITGFGDSPCLVSKWYKNGNAHSYLERNRLTIVKLWMFVQNVVDGLAYLHALNVTHGDLTPRNILIDDDGVARLCDFGLITLVDWRGSLSLNSTTSVAGVLRYQAPELISPKSKSKPKTTFASDVYSFACIASEFLTGNRPFSYCSSTEEVVTAVKRNEHPAKRPERLLNSSEEKLWALLDKCWNSDPSRRPKIEEVVSALKEILPEELPPRKEATLPPGHEKRPSLGVDPKLDKFKSQPHLDEPFRDSPTEQAPINPPGESNEYILVMGQTGSGKTTFINKTTNSDLLVGHVLESCTEHVNFSQPLRLANQSIILFDTPGLDATRWDDADIFTEIAVFLTQFEEQKRKLIGVIYIHDMCEIRIGGTAVRNLEIFKRAVGDVAAKNVVIVTNKWDCIQDKKIGEERLATLQQGFFKTILDAGARMHKLMPGTSGLEIVQDMVERHNHTSLLLPIEFGTNGSKLKNTDAGNVLDNDYKQRIQEFTGQPQPQLGEFIGSNSDKGSVPPPPKRKGSKDSRVKEFEKKREKMDRNFEEAKKTPIGQRVVNLLGGIFKNIIPRLGRNRGLSAAVKPKHPSS